MAQTIERHAGTTYRVEDLADASLTAYARPNYPARFVEDLAKKGPEPLDAEFEAYASETAEWAALSIGAVADAWPEG